MTGSFRHEFFAYAAGRSEGFTSRQAAEALQRSLSYVSHRIAVYLASGLLSTPTGRSRGRTARYQLTARGERYVRFLSRWEEPSK